MQTWTEWNLDDLRDEADIEGRVKLSALVVPEQRLVETLPYYSAFDAQRAHVTACASCRRDDREDCPEGEALLAVAVVGIGEQQHLAASN